MVVPIVAAHWSQWTPYHLLTWHAYVADATVTLDDFETYNRISEERLDVGLFETCREVEVLKYVQYLPGSGIDRFGLVAETATEEEWSFGATLQIDYSPPSLTDPGLSVYSPLPYADYWADSPVQLRATAQDRQDGNLDAQIYWTRFDQRRSCPARMGRRAQRAIAGRQSRDHCNCCGQRWLSSHRHRHSIALRSKDAEPIVGSASWRLYRHRRPIRRALLT